MSSFNHYLEKEVLDHFIKTDGLYIGLSRTDGVRNITENGSHGGFAVWDDDGEGGKEIVTDGIDEPNTGWFQDPEDDSWKQESVEGRCDEYLRRIVNAADWHDVEVVLGLNGDSELRLSADITFPTAGTGEDWGNISHFFIVSNATIGQGNILAYGKMPDSVHIIDGMVAKIWANTVVVRMTD